MRNNQITNKAFTLIELLVVIAIIGILSAIVLAALGSARSNAKEASILSSLNSARTQAELYHVNNGSYSGLCSDSKIQEIVASASSTGDGALCFTAETSEGYINSTESGDLLARDYGIATELDDTYYVASPLGSGTVGDENAVYGAVNWTSAKTACADAAGRLPSPSELRVMYNIGGSTPLTEAGFTANYHWSALESPADSSEAYATTWYNGNVYQRSKSSGSYVRCVD